MGTQMADSRRRNSRAALLEAARGLMARGEDLSVGAAAKAAGVSRATAYRQFSDAPALALAAMDAPTAPPPDLPDCQDPRERAHHIRRTQLDATRAAEAQLRQHLARALDGWVAHAGAKGQPPRQIQQIRDYRAALSPLAPSLGEAGLERAALMLTVVSGMESWVALRDVCGLTDSAAEALSRALADAVLDAILKDSRASR